MKFIFEVTYKSGRTETIPTSSGAKAKQIADDLKRAEEMGNVIRWKQFTEEKYKAERKKQTPVYLDDNDRERFAAAALANGTSVSAEIRKAIQSC